MDSKKPTFKTLTKIYGTDDPAAIQRYLIWQYIKKMAVYGLPQSEQTLLPTHDHHFEASIKQRPSS